MIFVFGSNLAGVHGAGAAHWALRNKGAIWGQGVGRQGNSYAIPTKDEQIRSLPITEIPIHIENFKFYAKQHPDLKFQVTCVGCGLAGFKDEWIAPMFFGSPSNCLFDEKWRSILGTEGYRYWGTF